ncbi:MAG TPA: toll/interleukin-1 receptor domain-containing protein [Rubrivivax sp.]|nr:toll/interleukin-1 receptor domain-containing protein [Rubrivivax sp.]
MDPAPALRSAAPASPVAPIFISYRRDDAAGQARAVEQALALHFGGEEVFIDVDDILAGEAFEERLRTAVKGARVVLVLIGRRWRGDRAAHTGQPDLPPRLFDEADFVRREVATALAAGLPVVPVLLDDTPMPGPADLPADLQALAGRHALGLDHERFTVDIERLVSALQVWVPLAAATASSAQADPAHRSPPRTTRRHLALGAGFAALAAAAWWLAGSRPDAGTDDTTAADAARAGINGTGIAEVPYAWLREPLRERFVFSGEGARVSGTASFLGVGRLVQDGRFEAGEGLQFVVHTSETAGNSLRDVRHRYHGTLRADGIHFEMQTEGASQPHAPLRFVARRALPSAAGAAASGGG